MILGDFEDTSSTLIVFEHDLELYAQCQMRQSYSQFLQGLITHTSFVLSLGEKVTVETFVAAIKERLRACVWAYPGDPAGRTGAKLLEDAEAFCS